LNIPFAERGISDTFFPESRGVNVIEETIKQINARIQATGSLTPERRRELLELLATLEAEAANLARTHGEQAQSIVGFTQVTAHEATRANRDPRLLNLSVKALRRSCVASRLAGPG
jgi:hypothetical protein